MRSAKAGRVTLAGAALSGACPRRRAEVEGFGEQSPEFGGALVGRGRGENLRDVRLDLARVVRVPDGHAPPLADRRIIGTEAVVGEVKRPFGHV